MSQTRQLGTSDMHITPIGVGAWAMGGSWGPQDDQDSIAAIHAALDKGINWIDTAAIYGLGRSEEVVGRAIKGRANRPYIFTKCAQVWDENKKVSHSLKAESVRREIEASLRRLQVDVVDLYQIHWPGDPDTDIEEGWATLAELQKAGKVRWIGVSNFSVEQMQRIQKIAPITSLQPQYSLLERGVETDILPFCRQQNIGVINYSPMSSGLLSGTMTRERLRNLPENDWRRRNDDFKEPRVLRHLEVADFLRTIADRHGRTVGEVAIAWTLHNPAVTGAIVGLRSAKQVDGVIGALDFRLSDVEIEEIEKFVRAHP